MYITYVKHIEKINYKQMTFEDLRKRNKVESEHFSYNRFITTIRPTSTYHAPKSYNPKLLEDTVEILKTCVKNIDTTNIDKYYSTFFIPKKTGGLRTISAPNDELKSVLQIIQTTFEKVLKLKPHNCAHAYVSGRNCLTDLKQHQQHKSRWFLKLDIKNFFPSCTKEYVLETLKDIYPLCFIKLEDLETILEVCFKDGVLPQGAPTSPLLSNLVMIPVDYNIDFFCKKAKLAYTRYADDILISSKYKAQCPKEVIKFIDSMFEKTPFKLKKEKTRYGSSSGRNWNLGLMLNKDNNITIGAVKKKYYKAMLYNLFTTHETWTKEDAYKLNGITSYYKSIEPKYIKDLIEKFETKYSLNYKNIMKTILKR